MYNEKLKLQFLEWRGSAMHRCVSLFNRIEQFEKQLDKDVLYMSPTEYHRCLRSAESPFMNGFVELFRLVEQYGEWAFDHIGRRSEWLGSCNMYEAYIQDAPFPDILTWDDIYAELLSFYPITEGFAIWPIATLSWLGLTMQECCDLRNEDMDLKNKLIHTADRDIRIETDSQWKILSTYVNTRSGIRTQNQTFSVELIDKGYFLKQTRTVNSTKSKEKFDSEQISAQFAAYAGKCLEVGQKPILIFSAISRMGSYHKLLVLDKQEHVPLDNLKTKEIQRIFNVTGVTPTKKMLITEYQVYLKKMEERDHK